MKPTVVILLSDKRSGSTMFEQELCKHPQILHVPYSPHSYNETHHWLKAACVLKLPDSEFYGGKMYRGYGLRSGARKYLIDCIKGNVPDFIVPSDDEKLVFGGWNALCNRFARPVFFEKSPQYLHHWACLSLILRWLETTDFDVRIIGLVRNPMAVQYSAIKAFSSKAEMRQFAWAQAYRNMLVFKDMAGAERFLLIRYEDLIEQPNEVFENVFGFIGVEPCEESGKQVHRDSVKKWIEDPWFSLQLDSSVLQIAKYFGYNNEDLQNLPKPKMPFTRRFSGRVGGIYKLAAHRFITRFIKPHLLPILRNAKLRSK
jgi:hypothetical protein